jgi:hypothetical protein
MEAALGQRKRGENRRRRPRRQRSYGWALRVDYPRLHRLDYEGQIGLRYARRLAQTWQESNSLFNSPYVAKAPSLVERKRDVASQFGISEARLGFAIAHARKRLFGNVSDQAIYKALRRDEWLRLHAGELCRMTDCMNPLPTLRRKTKMFCGERCKFRSRRYPELVAHKPRFPAGKQSAEHAEHVELTDRERRALELVNFRTQTGLKADDVAQDLGVLTAYQSAVAKLTQP